MKKIFYIFFLLAAVANISTAFGQKKKKPAKKSKHDYIITISTKYGDIELILFDETPIHKENFIKLTKSGYYDNSTFHRVLENFIIQGGDPNSKPSGSGQLGTGGPGYTLEAEINTKFKHDKGILAAARQPDRVNKERRSSGSQFYIVQNSKGAHHLDGIYTIFGRVIKGIEVVDKIAEQQVNRKGLPIEAIPMKVNYTKLKKKHIIEMYGIEYAKR